MLSHAITKCVPVVIK